MGEVEKTTIQIAANDISEEIERDSKTADDFDRLAEKFDAAALLDDPRLFLRTLADECRLWADSRRTSEYT